MIKYSFILFILFTFNSLAQKGFDWCFIENTGQFHQEVTFKHALPDGELFLRPDGISYHLMKSTDDHGLKRFHHTFSVDFLNAKNNSSIEKSIPTPHYFNYIIGPDQSKWKSEVYGYEKVKYNEIYNNIDFVMYDSNNKLKYDFIVKKGGNPANIKLKYNGLDAVYIDKQGKLHLSNSINDIVEDAPYVFQKIEGKLVEVEANYVLNNNTISYDFPKGYNVNYDLIIDPTLIMSTYSGSTDHYSTNCSAYDAAGNLYVAGGQRFGGFPVTPGVYQSAYQGIGADNIAIQKFDPAGTLLYATYFGGEGDYPLDITINNNDELVILAATVGNFPVSAASAQPVFGGVIDYGIGILSNNGTALIASTYLGGSGVEAPGTAVSDNAAGLFVTPTGEILVAGGTESADFPITPGAIQNALLGTSDGILASFNAGLTLGISTYIGGTGDDICNSVALGPNGNIYAVGNTTSADFPVTAGSLNPASLGFRDGFVIEISATLNPASGGIIAGTFLGTAGNDRAKFIIVNDANEVLVGGSFNGLGAVYPVSPGVFSQPSQNNLFVHKLDAALSTTIFATAIGCFNTQQPEIFMTAMGIDYCEKIYFTGASTGNNFPVTPDAISAAEKGLYMCVLQPNAVALDYGTYFGGNVNGQHFHPGSKSKYNSQGILFHTECTQSTDYPILNGVASSTGSFDGASFIFDFEFDMPLTQTNMVTPTGCNFPAVLDASDPNNVNVSYLWSTGETTPTISVNTIGEYKVQIFNACDTIRDSVTIEDLLTQTTLTAPTSCDFPITLDASHPSNTGVSYLWSTGETTETIDINANGEYKVQIYTDCDTIRDSVTVNLATLNVDFESDIQESCIDYVYQFDDLTVGAPADATYLWDFGDGTTSTLQNPRHTFAISDTLDISLTITGGGCESMGTKVDYILIRPQPIADFEYTPTDLSVEDPVATFYSTSTSDVIDLFWEFSEIEGEGGLKTDDTVTVEFTGETGKTYPVELTVINEYTCQDIVKKFITVNDIILLYVPNAFSPGSGTVNDIFLPEITSGVDPYNFRMLIFNRWGEIVFESRNYDEGWDGTFDNEIVQQDAYIWQIDFKESQGSRDFSYRGHVTVLR